MKSGFLITPSLYSGWAYWRDNDSAGKGDVLDILNKVRRERTATMQAGIDFEDAVKRACEEGTGEDECVSEAARIVAGGMWQRKVRRELDGDLLYGIADVVKRNTIFDIKRVNRYDVGKYEWSIQHLIYMYATGIENFGYVITDGSGVYVEEYHWEERSLETLRGRIEEMKDCLLGDAEMGEAFRKNWTYRSE